MWGERRTRVHSIVIAVLLLGSLTASLIDHPFLRACSAALSSTAVPVERPALAAGRWAGMLPHLFRQRRSIEQENARLRRRLLELEDDLAVVSDHLAQSRRELAAVAELADNPEATGTRPLLSKIIALEAEVAGLGADGWRRTCRVALREAGQAARNDPVVWGRSLVGAVQGVGPLGASVRLITDPESRVWCYDARSGVEGVAVGYGPASLRLEHVRWPADIVTGDVFLTAGKSGRFPAGLVVGEVTEVGQADDGLEADVRLRPRVLIREVRSVLVLRWPATEPVTSASR